MQQTMAFVWDRIICQWKNDGEAEKLMEKSKDW